LRLTSCKPIRRTGTQNVYSIDIFGFFARVLTSHNLNQNQSFTLSLA
jgi:hypothetical protein